VASISATDGPLDVEAVLVLVLVLELAEAVVVPGVSDHAGPATSVIAPATTVAVPIPRNLLLDLRMPSRLPCRDAWSPVAHVASEPW
jgi:hypothetical protein